MSTKRLKLPALLGFTALLCGASPALAQTSPTLGDAETFAAFSGSTLTAAGTGTEISGDVGVSPGLVLTGFPVSATVLPPFSTHVNDAEAIAAQISASNLFTDLAAMTGATPLLYELGGVTLTPGTYSFTTTAGISAGGTLTLDGAGLYVFKVGTTMTATLNSSVDLMNGATSDQVFWACGTTATLGGDFVGTVVTGTTITLGAGATVDGRLLAPSGAGTVTLAGGNTIILPETEPKVVFTDLGFALPGSSGLPTLAGSGQPAAGAVVLLSISGVLPSTPIFLVIGLSAIQVPFKGGIMVPAPDLIYGLSSDFAGQFAFSGTWPSGVPAGTLVVTQAWSPDPVAVQGFAATNGLQITGQ
jgi:hypothetical protein